VLAFTKIFEDVVTFCCNYFCKINIPVFYVSLRNHAAWNHFLFLQACQMFQKLSVLKNVGEILKTRRGGGIVAAGQPARNSSCRTKGSLERESPVALLADHHCLETQKWGSGGGGDRGLEFCSSFFIKNQGCGARTPYPVRFFKENTDIFKTLTYFQWANLRGGSIIINCFTNK
jgi:hypothetical protein